MIDITPPPAIYADRPYTGGMIIIEKPYNKVNILCRIIGADPEHKYTVIHGCSVVTLNACMIVIPKVDRNITERDYDAVFRHEVAHCNGWKHL